MERHSEILNENDNLREILSRHIKHEGRYYHGSPNDIGELLPSSQTGEIRAGEEDRRAFKDMVFFTTDMDKAVGYAGPGGVLYIVDASAYQYGPVAAELLDPKKSKKISADIYVAWPEDLRVVAKWRKEPGRKRRQSEKYRDEYVGP